MKFADFKNNSEMLEYFGYVVRNEQFMYQDFRPLNRIKKNKKMPFFNITPYLLKS
jgi:hypothetical protein